MPCAGIMKRKNGLSLLVPVPEGVRYIPLSGAASKTTKIRGAGDITCMAVSGQRVAVASGADVSLVAADGDIETISFPGDVDALVWVDGRLATTVSRELYTAYSSNSQKRSISTARVEPPRSRSTAPCLASMPFRYVALPKQTLTPAARIVQDVGSGVE